MSVHYSIAGYCRISVDLELDRDNTSIENQKLIISEYVQRYFPAVIWTSMKTATVLDIPLNNVKAIRSSAEK